MKQYRWILTALTILSAPAAGQVARAEEAPPIFSGEGNLAYVLTTGNTETSTLGLGTGLNYRPGRYVLTLKSGFLRTTTGGTQTANQFNLDLKGERAINERFTAYAQYGFLRNIFAGFLSRHSADAGMGYYILKGGEHELKSELGAGAVTENRTSGVDASFAIAKAGLGYVWKLSKTAELSNDAAGLVSLKNSDDWRLNDTLGLSAAMSTVFSLKFSFAAQYLHLPVPGRKTTDTTTTTALVAKF